MRASVRTPSDIQWRRRRPGPTSTAASAPDTGSSPSSLLLTTPYLVHNIGGVERRDGERFKQTRQQRWRRWRRRRRRGVRRRRLNYRRENDDDDNDKNDGIFNRDVRLTRVLPDELLELTTMRGVRKENYCGVVFSNGGQIRYGSGDNASARVDDNGAVVLCFASTVGRRRRRPIRSGSQNTRSVTYVLFYFFFCAPSIFCLPTRFTFIYARRGNVWCILPKCVQYCAVA